MCSLYVVDDRANMDLALTDQCASTDHSSVQQLTDDTSEDPRGSVSLPICSLDQHAPLLPPRPVIVDKMFVHGGARGIHMGDENIYHFNQIICNRDANLNLEQMQSDLKDMVFAAVKPTLNNLFDNHFLHSIEFNRNGLPDKKEFLQNKWFYLIAGFVALSCILCIVPPVVFTLNSVWGSQGEEVGGLFKWWCYVVGVLVAASCMNFVCTIIFSINRFRNSRTQSPTLREPHSIDNLMTAPRMMGRAFWLAQPPIQPLDNNSLPVKRVVICHTATEEYMTTPECCMQTRFIQMCHIEYNKWSDIGYNFLIGGDGCVYVGRGWEKVGAHTKGHNRDSLGIALMGTFTSKMPNDDQLEALKKLLVVGVETKKISKDYKLIAHCQLITTASPGMTLVRNMIAWPHFDRNLPIRCSTL